MERKSLYQSHSPLERIVPSMIQVNYVCFDYIRFILSEVQIWFFVLQICTGFSRQAAIFESTRNEVWRCPILSSPIS